MSEERSESQVARILERLRKEVMRERAGDAPSVEVAPAAEDALAPEDGPESTHPASPAQGFPAPPPDGSPPAFPTPVARTPDEQSADEGERPRRLSPTDGPTEDDLSGVPAAPSPVASATRAGRRRGSPSLHSKRVQAADRSASSTAVEELVEHRRRRRGKLFGIAGLPRHGKTTLADRLRERAADRPGADLRYNKTERGDVNIYYLPGRRDHHVLVDMAGEDYQVLGDYERELPELMEAFLWPVLQRLDGLALLMALPVVWSGWNRGDDPRRRAPSSDEQEEMAAAAERMANAHKMLLKYAVVARFAQRLRRTGELKSKAGRPPTRDQVDDAFKRAPKYDRPVAVVLSKADLYTGRARDRLHTPDLPRLGHRTPVGLRPGVSEPLLTAAAHFPDFLEFLERRVRCFKWSFCQALEDRSPEPDPLDAAGDAEPGTNTLIGGDGVVDFLARHPWRAPGLSSAMAIRLDRRIRREAWSRLGQERRSAPNPSGREG